MFTTLLYLLVRIVCPSFVLWRVFLLFIRSNWLSGSFLPFFFWNGGIRFLQLRFRPIFFKLFFFKLGLLHWKLPVFWGIYNFDKHVKKGYTCLFFILLKFCTTKLIKIVTNLIFLLINYFSFILQKWHCGSLNRYDQSTKKKKLSS